MDNIKKMLEQHFATDEVEITEELIVELTNNKNWKREHLEDFKKKGYKYSRQRNTIIVSTQFF